MKRKRIDAGSTTIQTHDQGLENQNDKPKWGSKHKLKYYRWKLKNSGLNETLPQSISARVLAIFIENVYRRYNKNLTSTDISEALTELFPGKKKQGSTLQKTCLKRLAKSELIEVIPCGGYCLPANFLEKAKGIMVERLKSNNTGEKDDYFPDKDVLAKVQSLYPNLDDEFKDILAGKLWKSSKEAEGGYGYGELDNNILQIELSEAETENEEQTSFSRNLQKGIGFFPNPITGIKTIEQHLAELVTDLNRDANLPLNKI